MKTKEPGVVYRERLSEIDMLLKGLRVRDNGLAVLKLVLLALGLITVLGVFSDRVGVTAVVGGVLLLIFVAAVVVHETVLRKIRFYRSLRGIVDDEIGFLDHRFPGFDPGVGMFKDSDHPYSSDLDIFSEKGLFHYVSRAVTTVGKRCLAGWLQNPAPPEVVERRQRAVRELEGKLTFRQVMAARGKSLEDSPGKLDSFYRLLDERSFILLGRRFWCVFIHLWPVLTLMGVVGLFFGLRLWVVLLFVLVQMGVNGFFLRRVSFFHGLSCRTHKMLKAYSRIISGIEDEVFEGDLLNALKGRLPVGGKRASECISRLSTLVECFDSRGNMLHFVLTNVIFWDLHCVYRIEKWRDRVGPHVRDWFGVIGEFESLSSFAALGFNNPGWVMPEVTPGPFRFVARGLGHPLIPSRGRVCSDFIFRSDPLSGGDGVVDGVVDGAGGGLAIVTGPNMAGKSTFLRSVGVNIILAQAGAPVCAGGFELSPMCLYSSMQAEDSLDRHLSLFYAELQRLKIIIDAVQRGEPVFFLVDEMLRGTNTLDRQKGALALLKQLLRSGAAGIAATHDLQLTTLESPSQWDAYPRGVIIANYHFDGYVEGDRLLFDYCLKPGICQSFNALQLMKKMGINL